ncbi:MAG: TRAP transporter small permease [Gemmobacter sp.]|jgi:TRAP-type C4-dicarboxylate transport system permease small subunit|nr:TRAP transporter small permease [Gemmobacter sp.]
MGEQPDDTARPAFARRFDWLLAKTYAVSMVVMLTAMTLMIGLDVILRLVVGMPVRGVHDLVGLGLLLLFVLALPYSWRGDFHVRMDMLYGQYGPGMKRFVDLLTSLAAGGFALLLAYQAARYIPHMMKVQTSSVTLGILYWPFTIAIMISAGLFALSILLEAALQFTKRKTRG